MTEKLFVIMGVRETGEETDYKGLREYCPVEKSLNGETLWLQPDRIIPESGLRYGLPKVGDMFLDKISWKFERCNSGIIDEERLILDPEPEEKADLQVLLESAPDCVDRRTRKWVESIIAYLEKGHITK